MKAPVAARPGGLVPVLALACAVATAPAADAPRPHRAVTKIEFIYEVAPFPSCHASTIVETPQGLVAAWFGGTREKHPDVGIWVSRHDGQRWSAPVEVARDRHPDGRLRHPCWNPVLFQSRRGPLELFYKVGPDPKTWWGMVLTSEDGGHTWSGPTNLPGLGPIKNKPIELANGDLLCPSSTEDAGWRVHFERRQASGTWIRHAPLNDGREFGIIQPAVLVHSTNRLQMLCRSRQGSIVESWSEDAGWTWSPVAATALANPSSGIDAVTLADGRHLLVYNPVTKGRTPLSVALSTDGRVWTKVLDLETQPGEYSYPAVIQGRDGRVHITYTWKREKIRHVVLDAAKL